MAEFSGGERLTDRLIEIAQGLGQGGVVRVGFLENATYPKGTPVALIALVQDMGSPVNGIPPRPFFRNMIAAKQGEWPNAIGGVLVANNYDVRTSLDITGFAIAGQLKQSIIDTNSPPLAASTIARKGHAKPLIDTSHMINSVDHEVQLP